MAPLIADRLLPYTMPNRVIVSPSNGEEWKIVLKNVKVLYLQRHYKQCASRSTDILKGARAPINPIYKVYLHYYRAISYEILGRSAHNYSSNKVPMLNWARDDYIECSKCIPELLSIPGVHVPSSSSQESSTSPSGSSFSENTSSTVASSTTPSTYSGDKEKSRVLDLDALLSIESISGEAIIAEWAKNSGFKSSFEEEECNTSLMPSPLRIRKSPRPVSANASPTKIPRPLPALPAQANKAGEVTGLNPRQSPTSRYRNHCSKDMDKDLARAVSLSRYNVIALSFSAQLNRNITSVSSLITLTRKLQRAHQATKNKRLASFWSFTPTETEGGKDGGRSSSRYSGSSALPDPFLNAKTTDENKEQRIARLRSEDWKTVGLKSKMRGWKGKEYYERFCSQALAELYEDEQIDISDNEQAFL
ncbi:hypothetical protein FQN54_005039 [Arachnomyces sp. PD_36]|nr:hypothetical protein FQN54_005039 [Arachnomyces sp. PD_36]